MFISIIKTVKRKTGKWEKIFVVQPQNCIYWAGQKVHLGFSVTA